MRFDPMTGQPIPEENEQPRFNPATGQPVQQAQNRPAFDPMTGQPINQTPYQGQSFGAAPEKPKKKTGLFLGLGAVAVVAALVIFLVVKVAAMFGSPSTKIEKALVNTFKQSSIIDTSVLQDSADDLQVDMQLEGKVEGVKMDASISYAKTKKEMSVSGEIGASVISTNFNFYMNQSKVCFDMKGLDPVYYDFTEEKDGDLEDLMGGDVTFDQIDTVLKTLADSDGFVKDLEKANSKALATLEFEKADKEEFEVDGKDVKCGGYTTTLDKDAIEAMLEEYKTVLESHEDIVDLLEEVTGTDLDDMVETITGEMGKDDEVEITFYLYKDQVAAIVVKPKKADKVEVLIEGGSFPTQNMKVKMGKETIYEVKGKEKDGKITQEVYNYGTKTSEMEYDKESGDISISYTDEYGYSSFTMSGKYEKVKGGFKLTFDDIEFDSYGYTAVDDFELTIQATKGAKIEKVDIDDDALDLGNADEDDLEDYVEDIEALFGGF